MKIVHLCLACFFPDHYSYQENLLPKFHRDLGYNVEVIASLQSFDSNGRVCYLEKCAPYLNENGLYVTRLAYRRPAKINRRMRRFVDLAAALEKAAPDILFIHGCQFLDINVVVRYVKRHRNTVVYVDNHADFSNSATNPLSLHILHKMIWKRCAHQILPYTKKFYGVLPARVDFLKNVYGLPAHQVELLHMGAEDSKAAEAAVPAVRSQMRSRYGIAEEDFLIVTGGKIDLAKRQILLLMQAVQQLSREQPGIKLIVFGSVIPELEAAVKANQSEHVQYIGWVNAADTYRHFGMADLVCFPGRHSVLWEQAAGMGIPLLVKYWDGTTHIDAGGNAEFLYEDSVREIVEKIERVRGNYTAMEEAAAAHARDFLYSEIAKKSLQ